MAMARRRSNLELPADLRIEILLRLPVKSIIRFRSLSKTYYHLFKNPTFVSRHLSVSKKKNRNNNYYKNSSHSLVVHYYSDRMGNNCKTGKLFFSDEKTFVSYNDLHQQLPYDVGSYQHYKLVVEDGLVCFYGINKDYSRGMILWNPATKESRILPPLPENPNQNPLWENLSSYNFWGCGMEMNPLSNEYDYKVIVRREYYNFEIQQDDDGVYNLRDIQFEYAVYSLSSDCWRLLNLKEEEVNKILKELTMVGCNTGGSCVNGVCYWQVEVERLLPNSGVREYKVLAFHFNTEVFQVLESPIFGELGTLIPLHDGRITIWECPNWWSYSYRGRADHDPTKPFDVWVLNDEDEDEGEGKCYYWTKLFNIDPFPKVEKMYGFWTHGNGKVFVEDNGKQLWIYDLETRQFCQPGVESYYSGVYIYEETLLPLNRIREF